MIVSEKDFKRIELGTIIWQCYYEGGYPKIGKTFVKGKKIDRNGVYVASLVKDHGDTRSKRDKSFASKKSALKYYKSELELIVSRLKGTLESAEKMVENVEPAFELMCKESEKNLTNKGEQSWMDGMFSEGTFTEVKVNTDQLPTPEYEVGEKVFTVFDIDTSNIYGRSPKNYIIVEDSITEVDVSFRDPENIKVEYETQYCNNNHMRGERIYKTKEEAEQYCKDHAQGYIDSFNEKMTTIEYKVSAEQKEKDGFGDLDDF